MRLGDRVYIKDLPPKTREVVKKIFLRDYPNNSMLFLNNKRKIWLSSWVKGIKDRKLLTAEMLEELTPLIFAITFCKDENNE